MSGMVIRFGGVGSMALSCLALKRKRGVGRSLTWRLLMCSVGSVGYRGRCKHSVASSYRFSECYLCHGGECGLFIRLSILRPSW